MLHDYSFCCLHCFMSIVVSMKIQQHGKMGVSCRFDAFERNAKANIRSPIVLTVLNGFYFCRHFYVTRLSYYDINKDKKPLLVLVLVLLCVALVLLGVSCLHFLESRTWKSSPTKSQNYITKLNLICDSSQN